MNLREAVFEAIRLGRVTGREHLVRNSGFSSVPKYFICPRYEIGMEGYRADLGYAGLGTLSWMRGMPIPIRIAFTKNIRRHACGPIIKP